MSAGTELRSLEELSRLEERHSLLEQEMARTKEAIRASEQSFRARLDAAPVLMWMSGTDGLCTHFNRSWLRFRGRTMEQELGNGWADGVHPDDVDVTLAEYQAAFAARRDFRLTYRLRRFDGQYCWIVDAGVPRYELQGQFAGYAGCGVETSERTPQESAKLTKREQQVLVLVADGRTTKEIGAILHISPKTADSHRTNLMAKLKVHETASLVRLALRMGVVEP